MSMSALPCGRQSSLIQDYFGTTKVHIVVDSLAFKDGVHTHTFDDTRDLFGEVFWARIYAGFHYRNSLKLGGWLGRQSEQECNEWAFRAPYGQMNSERQKIDSQTGSRNRFKSFMKVFRKNVSLPEHNPNPPRTIACLAI